MTTLTAQPRSALTRAASRYRSAQAKAAAAQQQAQEATAALLPVLREEGAKAFGSVWDFAEALAQRTGYRSISMRSALYGSSSSEVIEAAIALLEEREES